MAITCTTRNYTDNTVSKTEMFAGRVLKVEQVTETRNWSDTMDYTDYRTTKCTYALVWLGTHNLVPSKSIARPMAHYGSLRPETESLPDYLTGDVRELEFFEQFAWVDCTNLFSDRMTHSYTNPASDAAPFIAGDPLMWANFIAWESYMAAARNEQAAAAAKAAEARRIAEEKKAAADAARAAKREAKAMATKVAAEAAFVTLPANGTTMTVKGFTGNLFWKKITQYRGTWAARFGLKDTQGNVSWFTSEDI